MPSLFSQQALDKVIQENLPPTAKGAIVGIVDDEGAKVVVGVKFNEGHVEVQGVFQHDWDDSENHVGGRVLVSF